MLVIWNERARPLCERRGTERPVMSSPAKRTLPLSGSSSPESCLMKVVLPAPLGPITACVSPARTSKSTLSVARSAPKVLRSTRVSRSGSVIALLPRQQAGQPAPREQHHQHEDDAQVELPVIVDPLGQHAPALQQ